MGWSVLDVPQCGHRFQFIGGALALAMLYKRGAGSRMSPQIVRVGRWTAVGWRPAAGGGWVVGNDGD